MFHFAKGNATDDEDVGILVGNLQGKVGGLDGILVLANLKLYACHFGIVGRFGTIEHYGVGDIVERLLIEVHLVFTLVFDVIECVGATAFHQRVVLTEIDEGRAQLVGTIVGETTFQDERCG